jgi:hypothetical protein
MAEPSEKILLKPIATKDGTFIPFLHVTYDEINTVLDRVRIHKQEHGQSMHPGMTYEEGITDVLEWLLGEGCTDWDWPFGS